MAVTGSCICGQLQYSCKEPVQKVLCHCLQCRKVTGSVFTTALLVPKDTFQITQGAQKQYTFTQESGLKFAIHFCDQCGSSLGKSSDEDAFKDVFILAAGTVDEGVDYATQGVDAELWVKHRVDWVGPVAGAAQMQAFS